MLGYRVDKEVVDARVAQTALELRSAFDKVETVNKWLSNVPVVEGVDPLVENFNYTADEAYALRVYFETFDGIRTANASAFDTGRKMTGLE